MKEFNVVIYLKSGGNSFRTKADSLSALSGFYQEIISSATSLPCESRGMVILVPTDNIARIEVRETEDSQ